MNFFSILDTFCRLGVCLPSLSPPYFTHHCHCHGHGIPPPRQLYARQRTLFCCEVSTTNSAVCLQAPRSDPTLPFLVRDKSQRTIFLPRSGLLTFQLLGRALRLGLAGGWRGGPGFAGAGFGPWLDLCAGGRCAVCEDVSL